MSTKKQVKHTLLSRIADKVRGCDYYRVMPRELTEPTVTGASGNFMILYSLCLVSLVSMTVLMFMLVMEFAKFLTIKATSELALFDPSSLGSNTKVFVVF